MPYQTVDDINAATDVGYEQFQQIRDAARAAVYNPPAWLGGSRRFSVQGTGYQDAYDAVPLIVPDTPSSGATYRVKVSLRTADAGTTITPRVRNITDASDAAVGSAENSITFNEQTLTFAPVVGKEYRLQFVKSNDDAPCWGFGVLQRTDS
jgi:hypothetical protein